MAAYEIIIRGGTIVDGSGAEPFIGDVGVSAGRIAAIGAITETAAEEVDAAGLIVTPGFVDVHTHYDGQITWDSRLAPSSEHGVTTAVFGNCGVGFAPVRHDQREVMIRLMEGVEDIPGVVMAEGVPFNWETFPEYLDALAQRSCDIDFAAQIPHSPLRVYVMGDRALSMPATGHDLAEMRRLVKEAVEAGALGVTTSRSIAHRFPDGKAVPSVKTGEDELLALAAGLRDCGRGVFQINPNFVNPAQQEFALLRRIAEASGRPLAFTLMAGRGFDWPVLVKGLAEANSDNVVMRGQSIPRSVGILLGLETSYHPFSLNRSYRAIADLPLTERVARMRDSAFRKQLLSEQAEDSNPIVVALISCASLMFPMGNPPNYLPRVEDSFGARAQVAGLDVRELVYDALLQDEGHAILFAPKGNVDGNNIAAGKQLFKYEHVLPGLSDGGAHYGMICDASLPTYFLMACVRDADPGEGVTLQRAIKLLARDTAVSVGLEDRGLVQIGYKADLNVIDLDRLALKVPVVTRDLPANGRRINQKAIGYVVTLVSGAVTYRDGEPAGVLPGRLIRGAQRPLLA